MNKNNARNNKRQRLDDDGEETDGPSEIDVRLSEELRGLLGGRKYVKAKDLTREILLEYAKRQGAVTEVDLLHRPATTHFEYRDHPPGPFQNPTMRLF